LILEQSNFLEPAAKELVHKRNSEKWQSNIAESGPGATADGENQKINYPPQLKQSALTAKMAPTIFGSCGRRECHSLNPPINRSKEDFSFSSKSKSQVVISLANERRRRSYQNTFSPNTPDLHIE